MAEPFELGIFDLRAELLAYAAVFFGAFHAAGAVASRALQSGFDGGDDLGVGIIDYFHWADSPIIVSITPKSVCSERAPRYAAWMVPSALIKSVDGIE